jgi:hypothetical protein
MPLKMAAQSAVNISATVGVTWFTLPPRVAARRIAERISQCMNVSSK